MDSRKMSFKITKSSFEALSPVTATTNFLCVECRRLRSIGFTFAFCFDVSVSFASFELLLLLLSPMHVILSPWVAFCGFFLHSVVNTR